MATQSQLESNNPLDIEFNPNVKWIGLSPIQNGGRWAVFLTPAYCYRAGAKILEHYETEGVNTVAEILSKFAPGNENPTAAYIKNVCEWTGFKPDTVITADKFFAMLKAMTRQEDGDNPYPDNVILCGIAMANPNKANPSQPVGPATQEKKMADQSPSLTPSNSTTGSAIGGALAVVIVYIFSLKGITLPAGVEAAVAAIMGTMAGYLPASGRK